MSKVGLDFIVINGKLFMGMDSLAKFIDIVSDGIASTETEVIDDDTKVKMIMGLSLLTERLIKETDSLNVNLELNDLGFPQEQLKVQKFEVKASKD